MASHVYNSHIDKILKNVQIKKSDFAIKNNIANYTIKKLVGRGGN